jgi:four helix bundle protein
MAKMIERFEDLIAWQTARNLPKEVYIVTRKGAFMIDVRLSSQIQSATVSIMSNIAEGFERGGRGELQQFLSTARASCAETRSQLYVALDIGYIGRWEFDRLLLQAEEVARLIGALVRLCNGNENKSKQTPVNKCVAKETRRGQEFLKLSLQPS